MMILMIENALEQVIHKMSVILFKFLNYLLFIEVSWQHRMMNGNWTLKSFPLGSIGRSQTDDICGQLLLCKMYLLYVWSKYDLVNSFWARYYHYFINSS